MRTGAPRLVAILLWICAAWAPGLGAEMLVPAPPEVDARAYLLMDAATGAVIAEHNARERHPPASLTKMMTSYLVSKEIAEGRLKEDDLVRVSEHAWRTGGWASGSSVMSLLPGEEVRVIDLLRGVIIMSGNDASIALAEHIAGSEEVFADLMNQQAKLLGLADTHFTNSTGLPDPNHYSTAYDMALLARALIHDFPEHYRIYAEKYFEHSGHRQANRNRLLWRDPSVDGVKTGHTSEAGYCLVASAERDGMRLIAVVLGAASEEARARHAQALLAYGFRFYETARLVAAGEVVVPQARVWYGDRDRVDLVAGGEVLATVPRGSRESLERQVDLPGRLEAPFAKGQQVGTVRFRRGEQVVGEAPLVAGAEVARGGLFSRLWDFLVLFFMGLFGEGDG
ncbi:MAG: D-Ala-D-Ala carboxypeptidase [Porticoccaceae bacterium]|nr:MAG: D-Ala-D-Ala carboxypeptidase [Porticoccaceae bacterium]